MLKDSDMQKIHVRYAINQTEVENPEHLADEPSPSGMTSPLFLAVTKHRLFIPSLYIILGILVFFAIFIIFNTYFLHLKVETAVVSAPIETMVAPMNGYITQVYVTPGAQVKKGAPLLKIDNIALERALQLAKIRTAESKIDIDYYHQLILNEQQRLNIYKKIGGKRVVSAKTQVNRSLQEVLTTRHNLDRFQILNKKHYISTASLEAERAKYLSAQETLADAKAQHKIERYALHAIHHGMYFTGTKTEGVLQDLDAQYQAAQHRAVLNQHRVTVYENLIKKLTLQAPYDGKITQILKSEGNTTDDIKPLILIENSHAPKQIIAYLTQDEILKIAMPDVKIYVPSLGKTYSGQIMAMDRTDGFVDEVKAQYRWRDFQMDRSAKVIIDVQKKEQANFARTAFSGMPVVVYFSKKHMLFLG